MIADIELFTNADAIVNSAAEKQRALLAQAFDQKGKKAAATIAAAELLRWYVRFGHMDAPEAQAAIEDGIERVMLKVARAAMEVKSRVEIKPLDFFESKTDAGRGGPKKAGVKQKLLELRAAHGDYLTEADMREVLTTNGGRSLPRHKWPSSLDIIEDTLTAHLVGAYSDVPAEQRRAFVRESFPNIPWGTEGRVVYPSHW